ncbi:hypothetical protein FC093_21260 [Ilyomonas limi]|uniref:RNA 2'-phosphotransferase n=1 Tax=Ilyomonas limi TaxID=2575867 RepID=A0A4U3KV61_9BACT|nr:RNA 2'-phosphotransferase [Ilyomonas limi]TKK64907.1 hypothetical protein FC093_21260 [Ilyomonas limi]
MLNEKEITSISKFLSLVLRHKPETIGLQLSENGWADVEELIAKINAHTFKITKAILNEVVVSNLLGLVPRSSALPLVLSLCSE